VGEEFEYGAVAFFELENGMKHGPAKALPGMRALPKRRQAQLN